MKIKYNYLLTLPLLSYFFAACSTVTNLQTARTLDKGQIEHTIAAGYGAVDLDSDDLDASIATTFTADYMGRYGLTDQDEIGIRLANLGTYINADYKRALLKKENIFISAGLAVGGTQVTIGSGTQEIKTTYIDIQVPFYIDYWLSPTTGLFFVPKYVLSMINGANQSDSSNSIGASIGSRFKATDKLDLLIEAGYLHNLSNDSSSQWQTMLGFIF